MKKLLLIAALGLTGMVSAQAAISTTFQGFTYDSSDNLWKTAELNASWKNFSQTDWSAIEPQAEISTTDNNISFTLPANTGTAQWNVQLLVTTNIAISATETYDFSVMVKTTKEANGILFKLYNGNDSEFLAGGDERVDLPEGESCYYLYNVTGVTGSLQFLMDLPGMAGATVELSNIVFRKHVDDPNVPQENGPKAPQDVPTPTQPASDVLSIFGSSFTPATTIGTFGGWGGDSSTSVVTIDNKQVICIKGFNYTGLWNFSNPATVDVTGYDYLHVDYWTETGTTFGITPVSEGPKEGAWTAPTVEKETWNSYDIPLSAYNGAFDLNKVFQIKLYDGGNVTGYVTNIYFYKSDNQGNEPSTGEGNGNIYNGSVKGTCTGAYLDTQTDADRADIDVTINYSVTWLENGNLLVKLISLDPSNIVGMSPQIDYQGVHAFTNNEYTIEGDFKEGDTVNFGFYLAYNANAVNVPVVYTVGSKSDSTDQPGDGGGDEDDEAMTFTANGVKYTVDWTATWNTDETITFNITITPEGLEGISPQMFADKAYEGNFQAAEGGSWTYTTKGTYEEGQTPDLALYVAYAGGATEQMPFNYTVEGEYDGVDAIDSSNANAPVEFYNLQGVKVVNPQKGIYILRQGHTTKKVMIK